MVQTNQDFKEETEKVKEFIDFIEKANQKKILNVKQLFPCDTKFKTNQFMRLLYLSKKMPKKEHELLKDDIKILTKEDSLVRYLKTLSFMLCITVGNMTIYPLFKYRNMMKFTAPLKLYWFFASVIGPISFYAPLSKLISNNSYNTLDELLKRYQKEFTTRHVYYNKIYTDLYQSHYNEYIQPDHN